MKKNVLSIFAVAALTLTAIGCKKEAKKVEEKVVETVEKTAETVVATKYKVVAEESSVSWKANKIVGSHAGTFTVNNGVAKFNGNQLVGGSFILDIKSLKITDIKEDDKQYKKLVGHLLSPDFFNADANSTAMFEITSVNGKDVTGDLTLNGIKKSVTFPVTVATSGEDVTLLSNMFTIDRTEWGIKYNSDKIADPKKLGDKLIKNDVEMTISVKAKKA